MPDSSLGASLHLADEGVARATLVRRIAAIEAYCEQMHRSSRPGARQEIHARRLLWAVRGTNDDPLPPSDEAAIRASS